MRKITEGQLALGSLFAFALWIFVALPFLYAVPRYDYPHDHGSQQTTDTGSAQHKPKEPFWERATDDPVAVFTLALVVFTFVLAASTIGLWIVTAQGVGNQAKDTRILQRAYISVEPDGLHPYAKSHACITTVIITNVGHLPARNVRWAIHSILDFDDRRPRSKLTITWPLEGEITLSPGAPMKQGALEPRKIGHDTESLRPQVGLYIYVWGVVRYDDGFGNDRSTYFCHRYNCVNLRNVNPDVSAPGAFRYDSAATIAPEHARYHRYGNDAN